MPLSGFISDKNNTINRNKQMLRDSYFKQAKKTTDEKKTTLEYSAKIPNKMKQQIRRENKRREIIRSVLTITILVLIGLFAFLLFTK